MPSIFHGADNALRDIKKLKLVAPDLFAAALFQEAQIEAKEVRLRTPVDTGALRASIIVTEPQRQRRRIWVTIEAGGPSAPYGFYVHEDLEAFHRVGEAKFIERPLAESRPFLPARIAARIDFNRALK